MYGEVVIVHVDKGWTSNGRFCVDACGIRAVPRMRVEP